MTNINDLPAAVLAQILYKAAATSASKLSKWKAKLSLLAVCRTWTKLPVDAVFFQIYVEVAASPGFALKVRPFWTSNAELLISRGCVLKARLLTIEWLHQTTPDHLRFIALDILKLDRVDWQNINSLTFTLSTWGLNFIVEPVSQDDWASTDVARTVQYFKQNLRNIVVLDLCSLASEFAVEYLYSILTTFYGGRLQVLRAEGSNPLPFSCIPRNIRVLDLTLDSSAVRVLPSICGETLKALVLNNVPRNFAWHHFRYDMFDHPIVFRQLVVLHLTFEYGDIELTKVEIQDKIASGAHNCDQLCFPALKQLFIRNCTPDCDLLYADHPFPELNYVVLSGHFDSIRHCSRLSFTWVRELYVVIDSADSADSDDMAEIYRVTNHFFTNICIGRTASLRVTEDCFILDPELVRWVNLTKLQVGDVDYAAVCKAIGQLPNLCELIICSLATSSSIEDLSLFINADPMLAWGEKLAKLTIHDFSEDCLTVCVCEIQALILHADALEKLKVPYWAIQDVTTFIDMYKDRLPHLANIQLLKSFG